MSNTLVHGSKSVVVDDPAIRSVVEMIQSDKYNDAIKWIQNKAKEAEQIVTRTEIFDAYPADGANAFTEVLKEVYGWIEQKPIPATWFSPEKPPKMLVVETGVNTRTEVPWGIIAVPKIDGTMSLGTAQDRGMWKFSLTSSVKKKHVEFVKVLCDKTRVYLREHSIYRGKPVSLAWKEEEASFFSEAQAAFDTPTFMPPSGLYKHDLILPEVTYEEINATIFSLIENADLARKMGVPTKRLVLGAGPFGTGKTLMATITADLCRQYNRTFFYLKDVSHLADCIHLGQQYSPACIFGEDIDSIDDPETIDEISNTIDGVDTKNIDILFILTTNHIERIPKKFLRSGRSDMIIRFTPPDAKAAARLILRYGGQTLEEGFNEHDAMAVAEPLAKVEMIPASIREVVERAKLFALAYKRDRISKVDLQRASNGVIDQCDMLKEKRPSDVPENFQELGTMFKIRKVAT